ncbi:MAG: glycosyltransferase WbuB, partial [Anaerolineaceae bacterium]|nr:glycosyltransferase WbuB [Anaerolineaceae bacterium]
IKFTLYEKKYILIPGLVILKKILIIGLNFYPEPTSTGKYTGELATYLCQQGYPVHVITAPPYYPHWRVAEGYRAGCYTKEKWEKIEIFRCPLWVPRRPTGLTRLLHLASFALSSLPMLTTQLHWKPDLILCVAPTLMTAPGTLLLARLCKAKSWLHLQDFELDAALGLGLLPVGRSLVRLAEWLERLLLNQFDRISTISKRMKVRLLEKGLPECKCTLLPNWVDTDQIYPLKGANPLRAALKLPKSALVALYAGNLGRKQGLETVIETARLLQNQTNLIFILCGDGAAREELEHTAEGLNNLRFLPVQPVEKLNQLLNLADIHLLPQKTDAADLVMPSKLSGMLASGRAVIATSLADTEIGEVISQTGVLVPPEDAAALAGAILKLIKSPVVRTRLGKKARTYALAQWSATKILKKFGQHLNNLV